MNFDFLTQGSDVAIAMFAAVAVFSVILVVSWPFLARDKLASRVKKVASEREKIRRRERQRITDEKEAVSLRTEPKRIYRLIVNTFNLAKQAEDSKTADFLKMAGYRGRAPVFAFVAVRLLAPIAFMVIATVYIFILAPGSIAFPVNLLVIISIALFGYYLPGILVRNSITKRQTEIRKNWPDALDLLLICVEAGMSLEHAFGRVSSELASQSEALADELSVTTAEIAYLPDRRQAYENLGRRTGLEGVKAVMTSLIQSERYGTSVGSALRVLAQENRDLRMLEAEKKAAALPPKLTVPMILFFLPVLFAVIITPAIIQLLDVV